MLWGGYTGNLQKSFLHFQHVSRFVHFWTAVFSFFQVPLRVQTAAIFYYGGTLLLVSRTHSIYLSFNAYCFFFTLSCLCFLQIHLLAGSNLLVYLFYSLSDRFTPLSQTVCVLFLRFFFTEFFLIQILYHTEATFSITQGFLSFYTTAFLVFYYGFGQCFFQSSFTFGFLRNKESFFTIKYFQVLLFITNRFDSFQVTIFFDTFIPSLFDPQFLVLIYYVQLVTFYFNVFFFRTLFQFLLQFPSF